MAIVGVILAGGLARRLGGGDKPLRHLAGRPILDHVISRLRPQVAALAINANGDPARFAGSGLPVIPDGVPGNPGPLAGILAGLEWAQSLQGVTGILTMPGDTPFLPLDLVARLEHVQGQSSVQVVVAESGGVDHPVVALWSPNLAAGLRAALETGLRRVRDYQDGLAIATVGFSDEPDNPFHNINTPEDLAEAERLILSRGGDL